MKHAHSNTTLYIIIYNIIIYSVQFELFNDVKYYK